MSLPPLPGLPPLPAPDSPDDDAQDVVVPERVEGDAHDTAYTPSASHEFSEVVAENFLHRADPYYSGVFTVASQSRWVTSDDVRAALDYGYKPAGFDLMDDDEVVATLTEPKLIDSRLGLCSALETWGMLTSEQARDLTGIKTLEDPNHPTVRALFAAGIIDIGEFNMPLVANAAIRHPNVYRLVQPGLARETLSATHGFTQLSQIDGGLPRAAKIVNADRHNALTVELMLRMAERHPRVAMVLGERFASTASMHPEEYPKSDFASAKRIPCRGDAVIVLDSGVRIVVELTGSNVTGVRFAKKVKRWARWLTDHPTSKDPTYVLFVMAPHERNRARTPESIVRASRTAIESALKGSRAGSDSPYARIGAVAWEEFFPAPFEVDDAAFNALRVHTVQRGWDTSDWAELDPKLKDPQSTTAIIDNAKLLASTPWFLRVGDQSATFGGTMAERMGLEVPIPPAARDGIEPAPYVAHTPPPATQVIGSLGDPAKRRAGLR